MAISSSTSGGDSRRCRVCGNEFLADPCWPLGDAPCPRCGSLTFFQRLKPESTPGEVDFAPEAEEDDCLFEVYALLPDTPDNRREAAAVIAERERALEDLRRSR